MSFVLGVGGREQWGMVVWGTALHPEVHMFDSQWDYWLNPSGCTMALNSIQPITQISIRGISWGGGGKGGRCVGLTTLPLSYADYLEILGASNSWSRKGLSRHVLG
jgi:hypothetical protein